MVRRDSSCYTWTAGLDRLDCLGRRAVLQYNPQLWKPSMDLEQRGEEFLFCVENRSVGRWWHLAMEVEDHVDFLHGGKDGVESFVVDDARVRVGGDARGVGFDAGDSRCGGFVDGAGGDGGGEVEGHEVVDVGFETAELGAVVEGLIDGCDGGN